MKGWMDSNRKWMYWSICPERPSRKNGITLLLMSLPTRPKKLPSMLPPMVCQKWTINSSQSASLRPIGVIKKF